MPILFNCFENWLKIDAKQYAGSAEAQEHNSAA